VTNSLSFLSEVDHILMIDNGSIVEQGSYEQLISMNSVFAYFVSNSFTEAKEEEVTDVSKGESFIEHKPGSIVKM
jgi:ABC-type multidrug transport system ATPase subunit